MEYFIPLEIDDDDYPDLKCKPPRPARFFSEDCYVILHITSMEKAKKFTIFTWMGAKVLTAGRVLARVPPHHRTPD